MSKKNNIDLTSQEFIRGLELRTKERTVDTILQWVVNNNDATMYELSTMEYIEELIDYLERYRG